MSLSGGAFPPSIVPAQQRMTLPSNYLSFDSATGGGTFAQRKQNHWWFLKNGWR
jgi:hypothetical protein